jgi:peptide/nickel transport system substrate-binding protein
MAIGVASVLLAMAACSAPGSGSATTGGDEGPPVPGGTLKVQQMTEPRHFAPASQLNGNSGSSVAGNGVFGSLIEDDQVTGELTYRLATALETSDGGKTLDLKLRDGVKFTDGTPFNAEAVKFNWERLLDPMVAPIIRANVVQIEKMAVVDPLTLRLTMVRPSPHYAYLITQTSQNWIASPAALSLGDESFDKNPVGAGPFKLVKWTRQDQMVLEKNEAYWDSAKPYLDRIEIRTEVAAPQRLNALRTGAVDLSSESNQGVYADAKDAQLQTVEHIYNGGPTFTFNMRRAPFNDVRARQAVIAGIDLEQINMAAYNGEAEMPSTVFTKDSPFYSDTTVMEHDPAKAQTLLDELAADGKPLKFTLTTVQTADGKVPAESIQAQLGKLKNIDVKVEVIDFAQLSARSATKDFDIQISGVQGNDPSIFLTKQRSDDPGNLSGMADPDIDKNLTIGYESESQAERVAAYKVVQERIAVLAPHVWYVRGMIGVAASQKVHGIAIYGNGSVNADKLWITK